MAAYSDVADIRLNLAGFGADVISDSDINLFISKADAHINSIISNYYVLPFTQDPIPILKDISTDLTCYYATRRNYTSDSVETSDWTNEFKKDAEHKLENIKMGNTNLIDSSGAIIPLNSNMIQHNNSKYTPTFDIGSPLNWQNDPDRLDDIESVK